MGDKSKIEWCDASWNPVTGCTKVDESCAHCYAERQASWLQRFKNPRYANGFKVTTHEDALKDPFRWKRPRRIFVDSMSDTFHKDVPDAFIDKILGVAALLPWHTFLLLTKRVDRALEYFSYENRYEAIRWAAHLLFDEYGGDYATPNQMILGNACSLSKPLPFWPLPNVGIGCSVPNQRRAEERIPVLLQIKAAFHFVSYEPALGELDLAPWLPCPDCKGRGWYLERFSDNHATPCCRCIDLANASGKLIAPGQIAVSGQRLSWVVAGGESGSEARPAHPDWFRKVRDDCKAAGVPFLFKQWGEWLPRDMFGDYIPSQCAVTDALGQRFIGVGKGRASRITRDNKPIGRLLDGEEWLQFPEVKRG